MSTESLNPITPKEHDLKIWSRHFEAVISGKKKAELRKNDRNFQVGDTLLLREVTEPQCEYTGRKTYVTVTHIIKGGEMDVLSFEPQDTVGRSEISDNKSNLPWECPIKNRQQIMHDNNPSVYPPPSHAMEPAAVCPHHVPICHECLPKPVSVSLHALAGWLHGRYSGEHSRYEELDSKERKEWRTDAEIIANVYAGGNHVD